MSHSQGLDLDVKLVDMPDGSGWLYRPMLRGLCRYTDLQDGTLDLNAVAEMNDLLDIDGENSLRIQKAMNRGR